MTLRAFQSHWNSPLRRDSCRRTQRKRQVLRLLLVMAGLPKISTFSTNTTSSIGKILNVLISLENNGKSKGTIQSTNRILTHMSKHIDLEQPEQIKQFIARHQCTNSYKKNMCLAYNRYCKYYKIQWQMPKYKQEQRYIKVPTKDKLEMIIAHAGRKMATKLTISLETGIRPTELVNLQVKDIDLERKRIHPTTAKHGSARILKISNALQNMLADYINREKLSQNDKLFKTTPRGYSKMYRMTRNSLADKLHEPALKTIRLYDFRHYYATTLYHKTRDILLVMRQLGHKNIENTLIYTQLLNLDEEEEYICKTATTVKEATQLIENGFEYITEIDGIKLFRKRK